MFKFDHQKLINNISIFYRNVLQANLNQETANNIFTFIGFIENDTNWQSLEQINSFFIQTGIETGWRFRPIREIQAKSGRVKELQDKYWYTGFYGRGYLQITHKKNYEKMGKLLGIDLVSNPDILLKNPAVSYKVSAVGFQRGVFTGAKISDFINKNKVDYKNARKVVNGLDKADLIDRLCKQFIKALKNSLVHNDSPVIVPIDKPEIGDYEIVIPDDIPIEKPEVIAVPKPDIQPNQNVTIGVERTVADAPTGWNTWKTTIAGIIAAVSTPIATLSAWFKGIAIDPFILKALVVLSIATILMGFLFGLSFMIIRIFMNNKERERVHQITLEQMRLAGDPNKFNVKVI
jgi:hypothetical protein